MPGLQQLPDLQNAEFMPMYLQNRVLQQADQANQFNQTGLQQNQADLQAKTLENLFTQQNNPLKLENQRLTNTGLGIENRTKGVTADIAEGTKTEAMAAKRAELLKSASESDLNKLLADAQMDMQSDDPTVVQRGRRKMDASWGEITRRNTHSDAMEKQREELTSREKIAAGNNAATLGAARISADSRINAVKAKNQAVTDMDFLVNTGKVPPNKASVAMYNRARAEQDPEKKAELMDAARFYERLSQTTMPAVAGQAGKIDPSSMLPDLQTRPNPSAFGGGTQPQAPKTYNALPQGAKQIGTSKGKPVYQLPDGTRIIGE